ncbi:MAG: D-inositol-3-phosphate glycosyltransferase [Pedosphaera sp.]|nr:D-inositol-3-phosphate glycosyltransferase [Pedosphaera sp.]
MKVLFNHDDPFLLMHGGFQIQIEQTKTALEQAGVEVEYLRWWDDAQRGDILHFFGRPRQSHVEFAHKKGIKVVMTQLLTGLGSRGAGQRRLQKIVIGASEKLLPAMFTAPFSWDAYRSVDAAILLTPWEAQLMREMFSVPREKIHVIPNGVETVFLNSQPLLRGPWLVCTATITERKRVVELAEAAVVAQTPLWIIGKPYSDSDPYGQRFLQIARQNPKLIRYDGPIYDRAKLAEAYRTARGFVLLSTMESLSLSALEAAACELPLLLSDLPWARTVFQQNASYCPVTPSAGRTADDLQKFHAAAPSLSIPPKPMTWLEVATQLKSLYAGLLKTSR